MMDNMERLKKAMDSIKLSGETRERMLSNLKTGAGLKPRRKKLRADVLIAAAVITALLVTGAGAAYVRVFRNPEIVDSWEDMCTPPPAYSDSEPNSYSAIMGVDGYVPSTVEEKAATRRAKADTWDTDEKIYGSVSGSHEWTEFEVLVGDGDVLVRDVYATDGTAKREYTAKDPALLPEQLDSGVKIDFARLEGAFDCVPYANLYYAESDADGSLNGTVFIALYSAGENGGWVQVDCTTMYTRGMSGGDYILADTFDDVYTYTNAAGLEFIITVNGDSIDASCTTEHRDVSVTAAYVTTADVEAALECIAVG